MNVGVCRLTLVVPHSHSLKEKRAALRKIRDRVRARFEVALAEVGGQDTWQRLVLGFAVVASDGPVVGATVDKVVRFISGIGAGEIVGDERETLIYGDELSPAAAEPPWGMSEADFGGGSGGDDAGGGGDR